MGFCGVTTAMSIRLAGRVCTLCHFPYAGVSRHDSSEVDDRYFALRPVKKKGQVLIHGHTHMKTKMVGSAINVCVDAWDFRPVMPHDIIVLLQKDPVAPE
jgi:calcineurin-like phosphoesterase family protein